MTYLCMYIFNQNFEHKNFFYKKNFSSVTYFTNRLNSLNIINSKYVFLGKFLFLNLFVFKKLLKYTKIVNFQRTKPKKVYFSFFKKLIVLANLSSLLNNYVTSNSVSYNLNFKSTILYSKDNVNELTLPTHRSHVLRALKFYNLETIQKIPNINQLSFGVIILQLFKKFTNFSKRKKFANLSLNESFKYLSYFKKSKIRWFFKKKYIKMNNPYSIIQQGWIQYWFKHLKHNTNLLRLLVEGFFLKYTLIHYINMPKTNIDVYSILIVLRNYFVFTFSRNLLRFFKYDTTFWGKHNPIFFTANNFKKYILKKNENILCINNVLENEIYLNNIYKNKFLLLTNLVKFKKVSPGLKKATNLTKNTGRIVTNFFKKTPQNNSIFFDLPSKTYKFQQTPEFYKFSKLFKTLKLKKPRILKYRTKWFKVFFNNRKLLRFFYNIKFLRQYRLTRYFYSLSKKPLTTFLHINEYTVVNLLMRCRFALTTQHSKDLISLGYVYINGTKIIDYKYVLKVGDTVQLLFSKKILLNYENLHYTLLKRRLDIRYCFERWHKNRKNFYKQHTHRFPNWLHKFMYLAFSIPLFLEVDFITLSAILIRDPINSKELNPYFYRYLSSYNIRLYNWKYLS